MLSILKSNITTIDVQAWKRGKTTLQKKNSKIKAMDCFGQQHQSYIRLETSNNMYLYWTPTITTLLTSSASSYGYQCIKHNILNFYHNNSKGWSNSSFRNMHTHAIILM
jgi:hypothetical protein